MKYQLIAPVTNQSTLVQVLVNRGIQLKDIQKYTTATIKDVNEPELLGKDKLDKAVRMVAQHIKNDSKTIIIVDPDVDGNTASALLLNYFYKMFPAWTEKIDFFFHKGKQHGLSDCYNKIIQDGYKFVLCPDAGSNDVEPSKALHLNNIDLLILDHHDFDTDNPYALIINNQNGYSAYPNKALSGVGVVWQFCRYFDKVMNINNANDFLDLVAIGNCADMMDMRSIETSVIIHEGLKKIKNPFLFYMAQKNIFKLGEVITPIGAAFYITPLLNAIQRSGTQEEKKLVFESMLTYRAFQNILSTKRGHKLGEMEQLVEQAIRTCTNVKNRQTRVQDSSLVALEQKIEDEKLLNHKVLLLLLDDDSIPGEVRGLIANKFMAKYQRPCCLLTKGTDTYAGSARGCSLAGVDDFKEICLQTEDAQYAIGHPNAFGLSIPIDKIDDFICKTDEVLKDMQDEAIYYVDYIFEGQDCSPQVILDIADMSEYWGMNMDEPLIAINKLKVTKNMVTIYDKKGLTLKITLNNGITIMKFNATESLCKKLTDDNTGYIEVDIVGKCNRNEWMGNITPQIFIEDLNIIDSSKYYF